MTDGAATAEKTMKAAFLHKNGDPTTTEVLSVDSNVPVPTPAEGELLVQVHAASLNPIDWQLMTGDFPGQKQGTVGADVAGVVQAVGINCGEQYKVGDEIYADAIGTKGSFAEYVLVKASVASKKPSNLSMEEAASLPLAGLTALQGLQLHGNLQEGQKVLIFGGSGGVGSLAIQMAKALGAAQVYATGSNVDLIKKLGADVVVNYKEESLMDSLKGKDFDVVFDTIGGVEHWQVGQAALKKKDGTFITIVGDGGSLVTIIGKSLWRKLKGNLTGGPFYNLFLTNTKYEGIGKDMAKMTELVESRKVKPVLDERRFELTTESVHDFIKVSMSHRAKGKLILQVQK